MLLESGFCLPKRQLPAGYEKKFVKHVFNCYSGIVEVSDASSIDMIYVLAWCTACQIRIRVEHDIR
jgi:hypothetical protein